MKWYGKISKMQRNQYSKLHYAILCVRKDEKDMYIFLYVHRTINESLHQEITNMGVCGEVSELMEEKSGKENF